MGQRVQSKRFDFLEGSTDVRQQREASSSVSLTCFSGVSSDLPFRALQVLRQHGIVADNYVLSPHSVSLFASGEPRGGVEGAAYAGAASLSRFA